MVTAPPTCAIMGGGANPTSSSDSRTLNGKERSLRKEMAAT